MARRCSRSPPPFIEPPIGEPRAQFPASVQWTRPLPNASLNLQNKTSGWIPPKCLVPFPLRTGTECPRDVFFSNLRLRSSVHASDYHSTFCRGVFMRRRHRPSCANSVPGLRNLSTDVCGWSSEWEWRGVGERGFSSAVLVLNSDELHSPITFLDIYRVSRLLYILVDDEPEKYRLE